MAAIPCSSCKMKNRYETNPRSLLGRLWRWHTGWCPGWRKYLKCLPDEERQALQQHLDMLDQQRKG